MRALLARSVEVEERTLDGQAYRAERSILAPVTQACRMQSKLILTVVEMDARLNSLLNYCNLAVVPGANHFIADRLDRPRTTMLAFETLGLVQDLFENEGGLGVSNGK